MSAIRLCRQQRFSVIMIIKCSNRAQTRGGGRLGRQTRCGNCTALGGAMSFSSTFVAQSPPPKKPEFSSFPSSYASATEERRDLSIHRHRTRRLLLALPVSTALISLLPTTVCSAGAFDPVSDSDKEASAILSRRITEAVRLLDLGRDSQRQGDFASALEYFSQVIKDYKDFAFTDYARVGRALALYEIGDKDEAIAELQDVSISLKGYPEVHAALAAALYVDKHAPLLAENQFTIATLLDPHYTDLSYVRDTKHWPPSLVSSLKNFLNLS